MNFIHKILDTIEEKGKPGGPLNKIWPLLEAQETFFRSPSTRTSGFGSHVRDNVNLKRLMIVVFVALMPCLLFGIYNTGFQQLTALGQEVLFGACMLKGLVSVLPLVIISYAVGGFWEVVFSIVRGHKINEGFFVTALLYPLILPPTLPWWMAAVAISFGVVIGKEVFGGTGMNIWNPALCARAFIFFAYPAAISGDKVWVPLNAAKDKLIDGFTGATPLGLAYASTASDNVIATLEKSGYGLREMFLGFIPGSIGETSTLACLIGAAILLITGVASWRIMSSMAVGGILVAVIIKSVATGDSSGLMVLPWYYHLCMGGFAFGAVFMATDPVSAPDTNIGKYVYGFLIGALSIIIRSLNPAYPEGVMLAILFMNTFAAHIDYYIVQANIKRRLKRA